MRLARYRRKNEVSYGAIIANRIVCLPKLAKSQNSRLPRSLEEFIRLESDNIENVENLLENASTKNIDNASLSTENVTLLAPVSCPGKIICLGLNYRDHAAEQKAPLPDEPILFMKPRTAIIGPGESIAKPDFVEKLDYEAELAIVVGKRAKNVPVHEAISPIFGYTILNDVSARDIQFKDRQWTRGKSFDTFAPIGPSITTTEQLRDTSNLFIHTWVNDELRQNSTTRNMVFTVSEIIYHLSRVMTLEPCDVIATGTPSGVGFALKPQPKFLHLGDVVKIEIEGIGVLQNTVSD